MKKISLLAGLFFSLFIISCEPVEDIENEINAELDSEPVVGAVDYTLVEEDYTDVLDRRFPNFDNTDQAKELVPVLLDDMFPFWGKGSQALVTYDLYSPQLRVRDETTRYELSREEYDPYSRYGNFDDYSDIKDFLSTKYPDAADDDLVLLTFKFYDGSVNTWTQGFIFDGSKWNETMRVTDAQYEEMGHGRFYNFNSQDQAETKLQILLNNSVFYEEEIVEGTVKNILYKYYDGNVNFQFANYIYKDNTWTLLTNVVPETLQFGHDGDTWVPDNTIKYELTADDFNLIANALSSQYPGPTSSAGNYGNFDRRPGNSNFWSDEMILEAMNVVLESKNPDAENGQKYVITYAIYNGTSGTETVYLIKEEGSWIYNPDA
ncbi:hypothetical protein LB456_06355 [Psychroflexus sp. CAK57W]|uniref:hypothetical protein n=1 Tax=Psychroflexus curvus TaxID=2873595 RepID=UPI001CCE88E0|nr:hypothetical protein [Psychroflexus curvus]MBZ9627071.1 hypothetical protein [Psychroflexus curvus]MBZ9787077.1 hypothetical protein [Psychroflexus curvus]